MKTVILLFLAGLAALFAGCDLAGTSPEPLATAESGPTYTVVAQTVIAELTLNAPPPTPTIPAPTPEPTSTELPTGTPTPADTPAPVPVETGSPEESGETPAPSPTFTATAGPTRIAIENLRLVYSDNFQSPNRAWVEDQGDTWAMGYQDGVYRIFVNLLNDAVWSVKAFDLTDTLLEVDLARRSGPESGYFGLVCRHQDAGHYYLLVIGSDGFYGIGKRDQGRIEFLKEGMAPPEIVRRGEEINRVWATCFGEHLSLYANGIILVEAWDSSYTSGDIGLVAGTRDREGIEVIFDNFAAYEP